VGLRWLVVVPDRRRSRAGRLVLVVVKSKGMPPPPGCTASGHCRSRSRPWPGTGMGTGQRETRRGSCFKAARNWASVLGGVEDERLLRAPRTAMTLSAPSELTMPMTKGGIWRRARGRDGVTM